MVSVYPEDELDYMIIRINLRQEVMTENPLIVFRFRRNTITDWNPDPDFRRNGRMLGRRLPAPIKDDPSILSTSRITSLPKGNLPEEVYITCEMTEIVFADENEAILYRASLVLNKSEEVYRKTIIPYYLGEIYIVSNPEGITFIHLCSILEFPDNRTITFTKADIEKFISGTLSLP